MRTSPAPHTAPRGEVQQYVDKLLGCGMMAPAMNKPRDELCSGPRHRFSKGMPKYNYRLIFLLSIATLFCGLLIAQYVDSHKGELMIGDQAVPSTTTNGTIAGDRWIVVSNNLIHVTAEDSSRIIMGRVQAFRRRRGCEFGSF
jgi:hypothetical protein